MPDLVDMVPDPSPELLAAAVLARAARQAAHLPLPCEDAIPRCLGLALADVECELRPDVVGLVASTQIGVVLAWDGSTRDDLIVRFAVAARNMYGRATRVGKGPT